MAFDFQINGKAARSDAPAQTPLLWVIREELKLTGTKVTVVQQCSGIDGTWGLRAENSEISVPIAKKLADQIRKADGEVIAGDCHLANTAITEQTGRQPLHPMQVIARAYGISEEPTTR